MWMLLTLSAMAETVIEGEVWEDDRSTWLTMTAWEDDALLSRDTVALSEDSTVLEVLDTTFTVTLTRDEAASATADEDGSIWLDLVGGDFEIRYAAEPPPADSCKKVETPTWIVPVDPETSGTGVITPSSNISPMNPMACEMAENAPVSASGTSSGGSSSAIQP